MTRGGGRGAGDPTHRGASRPPGAGERKGGGPGASAGPGGQHATAARGGGPGATGTRGAPRRAEVRAMLGFLARFAGGWVAALVLLALVLAYHRLAFWAWVLPLPA